jgi:osmoprotectant transport system substrate-binding protein
MRRLTTAFVAALTSITLASCGLGTSGGFTRSGSLSGEVSDIDLTGMDVSVGSKNYTEQILLGKIGVVLLQSAGADVHDLTNIPGSTSVRQAQLEGDVNFSFDYTGTAWVTYMGETDPIPDEQKQYEAVRDADAENGLVWLPPAKMNNTYGLAVRAETAEKYEMSSLEDIAKLPEEERTYCVDAEFNARNDGFTPMLKTYDLSAPSAEQKSIIDTGAIYQATADGTCTLGEIFNTDGRIPALDLVPLSDPRGFFPKYNMAPVVNADLIEQHPEIEQLLEPVIDDLDDEQMQELNRKIDVDGRDYADVAFEYLQELGIVDE